MNPELAQLVKEYRYQIQSQYYHLMHPTSEVTTVDGKTRPVYHVLSLQHGAKARELHEQLKAVTPAWQSICRALLHNVWFNEPLPLDVHGILNPEATATDSTSAATVSDKVIN